MKDSNLFFYPIRAGRAEARRDALNATGTWRVRRVRKSGDLGSVQVHWQTKQMTGTQAWAVAEAARLCRLNEGVRFVAVEE